MLEEVVVPNRCNVFGERYGFVRYSNVRDVGKLLKAVNAVCFGNFHIKAKVANFDKAAARMAENELNGSRGVSVVRVGDPVEKRSEDLGGGKEGKSGAGCVGTGGEGPKLVTAVQGFIGGSSAADRKKGAVDKTVIGDRDALSRYKGVSGDIMKIGDVPVRVVTGTRKAQEEGRGMGGFGKQNRFSAIVEGQPSIQKLVQTYRAQPEDLLWARNGVIATVINGESVPLVQDRIADAGVEDIVITPLGAESIHPQHIGS